MRLCGYWDCMEEVEEGISFCREHARKLNLQLIDKCPKCGRYKDIRQKLCPDCNYGRPVAGWKISSRNLDEADEVQAGSGTPENPAPDYEVPVYNQEVDISSNAVSRGDAICPSCGSPHLTYKNVFDYFKCNDCETTFITPVYTYGETSQKGRENRAERPEPESPQPPARQEPPQARSYPQERYAPPPQRYEPPPPPPRYQQPPPPPPPQRYEPAPPRVNQPPVYRDNPPAQWEQNWQNREQVQWEEPPPQYTPPQEYPKRPAVFNLFNRSFDDRALKDRALKMESGQASKTGWLYLAIIVAIIAVIAVGLWFIFQDQISGLIGNLS